MSPLPFVLLLFSIFIAFLATYDYGFDSVIVMDDLDNEHNQGEPHLKVADEKKRRWNSFRRGKKQIKKLWKSKKTSKQVVGEDQSSHSGDSQEIAYDNTSDITNEELRISSPISPISTTSSVPSITLHRPSVSMEGNNSSPDYMAATTDDEDDLFINSKENHNPSEPKRGELTISLNNQESNVCIQNRCNTGILFWLIGFWKQSYVTAKIIVYRVLVTRQR